MAFVNYPMGYYPQQNYYAPQTNPATDMLNTFKAPYQPQPMQNPQTPFIWVESEDAARAYLVAPGNTVVLWDSKNPYIYVRSADASGKPNTQIYEYKERTDTPTKAAEHVCSCGDKFVTKEDFKALQESVERLTQKIEAQKKTKTKIVKLAEDDDDE
jgi:hypothetical protein